MLALILLNGIICAIAGALIGDRKNHKVAGMLCGLLLGEIGVLAVALWRVDNEVESRENPRP